MSAWMLIYANIIEPQIAEVPPSILKVSCSFQGQNHQDFSASELHRWDAQGLLRIRDTTVREVGARKQSWFVWFVIFAFSVGYSYSHVISYIFLAGAN